MKLPKLLQQRRDELELNYSELNDGLAYPFKDSDQCYAFQKGVEYGAIEGFDACWEELAPVVEEAIAHLEICGDGARYFGHDLEEALKKIGVSDAR